MNRSILSHSVCVCVCVIVFCPVVCIGGGGMVHMFSIVWQRCCFHYSLVCLSLSNRAPPIPSEHFSASLHADSGCLVL